MERNVQFIFLKKKFTCFCLNKIKSIKYSKLFQGKKNLQTAVIHIIKSTMVLNSKIFLYNDVFCYVHMVTKSIKMFVLKTNYIYIYIFT